MKADLSAIPDQWRQPYGDMLEIPIPDDTRTLRESGVDYFCYLANIKLLGVVRAHYLWCMMAE